MRVDLFEKGKLAAMPKYPGLSYVLSTYGKNQIPGKEIRASHAYSPTSQDATAPDQDYEWNVCA